MKVFTQKRMAASLILLCAVQWLAQTDFSNFGSDDFSSKSPKRTAELGKPVLTKSKPEKEVEVLLNDPAKSTADLSAS